MKKAKQEIPDLIICDVMMPKMSVHELVQALHERAKGLIDQAFFKLSEVVREKERGLFHRVEILIPVVVFARNNSDSILRNRVHKLMLVVYSS